jgi:plastocyanin
MKKLTALAVLALAALALVACGSSSDESTSSGGGGGESQAAQDSVKETPGGQVITIEAPSSGGLVFEPDQVTAKAGKTTIDFDNPQGLTHDLVVEDSNGKEIARDELVQEGSTTTTANLKPGTYEFYCSVPGHREAGMEGTLTVE